MLSEYTARNNQALHTLINEHKIKVLPLPDEVLKKLRVISDQVVSELAAKDDLSQRIYDSVTNFRSQVMQWHAISEQAFLHARSL